MSAGPVLFVSNAATAYGAELLMLRNASILADIGWRVTIAGPPGGLLESEASDRGLPFVPLGFRSHGGIRDATGTRRPGLAKLAGEIRTAVHNARVLRRHIQPGYIVHSNSMATHLSALLAARSRGAHGVAHLHDLVRPGLGRILLGVIALLSRRTIAISEAVAASVPRVVRRRVVIIPNGTDIEPAEPADLSQFFGDGEGPIVVCVARLHPMKRQDLLLDAWTGVLAAVPAAKLLIVGGASPGQDVYAASILERCEAIPSAVATGRIDYVANVLAASDVLAHPADAEPFGLGIIEAQAQGCAVAVSAAGGAAEIVEADKTGLLFEPGSREQLTECLVRLLLDDELRSNLEANAHRKVEAEYDLRRSVERLAELYGGL